MNQTIQLRFISLAAVAMLVAGSCTSSGSDDDGDDEQTAVDPVAAAKDLGCERAAGVAIDGDSGMPSGDEIYTWVEDLTSFGHRRSGSEGTRQAEAYIECHFQEIGLADVHFEESTTWQWEVDDHGLTIDGSEVDAFPAHHSFVTLDEPSDFSTGPGGLTAPIVDVGDGSDIDPAEVEGKVVLFDLRFLMPSSALLMASDFFWDPDLTVLDPPEAAAQANPYITNITDVVGESIEAGAVGFVGVMADYFESNRYYNEYYRSLEFTIPGFWVAPSEGERVRSQVAGAGEEASATLVMEGERTETVARTVIGVLPGRTQEAIQVQSHHDSTWDGGVQDASGAASVLALAHHFAAQPEESRERTLMFTTFSSHWTGYQAHQDFVEKYVTDGDSDYDLVANVTVEHIGKHGVIDTETRELHISDLPEPRGILNNVSLDLTEDIVDAVIRHDLQRTVVMRTEAIGMPTDASFVYGAGVPTVSFISGPVYLYDEIDTADVVARDELQPVALAFADIIEAIAATPSDAIGGDGSLGGLSPAEFDERMGGQRGDALTALDDPAFGEAE